MISSNSKLEGDAARRNRLLLLLSQTRPTTSSATDLQLTARASLSSASVANTHLQRLFDNADPVLGSQSPRRSSISSLAPLGGALPSATARSSTTASLPTSATTPNPDLWGLSRQILETSRAMDNVLQTRDVEERAAQVVAARAQACLRPSAAAPSASTSTVLPHAASILNSLLHRPEPAVRGLFSTPQTPEFPTAPSSGSFAGLSRGAATSSLSLLGTTSSDEDLVLAALRSTHQSTRPSVSQQAPDSADAATALMAALRRHAASSSRGANVKQDLLDRVTEHNIAAARLQPRIVPSVPLIRGLKLERQSTLQRLLEVQKRDLPPPVTSPPKATCSQVETAVAKNPQGDGAVFVPLAIEQDINWLSECQCMLRSDFIEVTQATRKEFNADAGGSTEYKQVGIRCRFCAHLPSGQRPSRSSAFPSSIKQLYQSFTMMQRDHFHKCKAIPLEKRQRLEALRKTNTQGACDSKQYWIYAAQTMGMFDTHRGIEMTPDSQEEGRKLPLFGVKDAEPNQNLPLSKEDAGPLVLPSDRAKVHPFLYVLLSQLELVELLPTEQAGKRKNLPVGFCGLGCRYCCPKGRLGFSRTFPLRRRTLPAKLDDMFGHMMRCSLCPSEVKTQLATLAGDQRKTVYQHPELLDRIWKQLGREGDVSC